MPEKLRFVNIVAHNLTELRERRGLTQTEAAKLCGVSIRTWYVWEKVDTSSGAAVGGALDSIAAAFEVPVERLLRAPRAPRSREKPRDGKSTRRFARSTV